MLQDLSLLEFAWIELLEKNKAVTPEELAEVIFFFKKKKKKILCPVMSFYLVVLLFFADDFWKYGASGELLCPSFAF